MSSRINIKMDELVGRNKDILVEYSDNLLKVEVTAYSKTSKEKDDFVKKLSNGYFTFPSMWSKELLEASGFKPFYRYSELIVDCINKVAKNEGAKNIAFKSDEATNHNKWIERLKKMNDGEIWVDLYKNLLGWMAIIHDSRVESMRKEIIKKPLS